METINAEAMEYGEFQEPNLDMENFLKYLMSRGIDCDTYIVYHNDKKVAENYFRFLGTFFPSIIEKDQKVFTDRKQLNDLHDNISRDYFNYGEVVSYKRQIDSNKTKINRILWVNLEDIERYSKRDFKNISFWSTYGKLVRDYGKEHF